MNTRTTAILLVSGLLSVPYLLDPCVVWGQAPAGPMPPAEPKAPSKSSVEKKGSQSPQSQVKQTLSGTWKLNRDQSDDAHKKMQEARGGNGGGGRGGQTGGGRIGGTWPFPGGGGGGPYGGRRGGAGGGEGDEDRKQMQELFNPADSLAIVRKDVEVDLTDDQNRKRVFYTDGRKLQKSKDEKYQELAARWEGDRLVAGQNGSRGGKITRSFEVAPEGQQLYETVRVDNRRSGSPVVIRYVYDVIREAKQ
jgi:hypothetical protein